MWKKTSLLISLLSLIVVANFPTAEAQEIKIDGDTATIVTRDGNRITIDGNTLSRDGKNLFHSFQEFGLTAQQIATFLTNPQIQNILTRVTGGNPSYIQGLIEVTGGNSNLFIMNPAGIVFGQGASLNVPADFTATTATGIGFANGMFHAVGSNDYQNLVGNPHSFVFNTDKAGSIINGGDLTVAEGKNLTLIGGNVINTGTIETPHGKINIQAVEGTSRIKITPEGSLLSLEVDIPVDERGNLLVFTPQDLPSLLTGASQAGVSTPNIIVNNNQVQVANNNIPNETGVAIASGKISTSSDKLGGEVTILGEKVGVIEGEITASGDNGGGKVLVGGEREGKGTIPNASITYVSPDSAISADGKVNGNGGEVIIFAEDYANIHGQLTAKGGSVSGNGGFIETSGKKSFNITSIPDTRAVNGIAGEWLIDPYNVDIVLSNEETTGGIIDSGGGIFSPPGYVSNTIEVEDLKSALLANNTVTVTTGTTGTEDGNITWQSGANLDFDGIGTGKTLVLRGDRNIIYNGTIQDSVPSASDSLNVVFNANVGGNGGEINLAGNIATGVGDLTLTGDGDITGSGVLTVGGTTKVNTNGNVILDNSGNDFNVFSITNANNVAIADLNNLTLLNSDNSGNPSNITITGNLDLKVVGVTNLNSNITANSIITDSKGSTVINTDKINTIGDQTYGDQVIFRQNTEINTNNLNAVVIKAAENAPLPASLTINAKNSINITGEANSSGIPLGISTARSSGSPSGNINLDAQGDININGAINTTADANSFVSQAGNINIRSDGNITALAIGTYGVASSGALTIKGNNLNIGPIVSNSFALPGFPPSPSSNGGIVNLTGTNINVQGAIFAESLRTNGIFTLSNNPLIVNVPIFGEVLGKGNVTTINSQNYNGNVIFASPVTMTTTNNGSIAFSGVVNGGNNNLTLKSGTGNVTFSQPVNIGNLTANSFGITTFNQVTASSLTTNAGGETQLNGNVTTTGNQNYGDNLTVVSNGVLTSNQGSLNFNGGVNAFNNLTLISLSGINFADGKNITGSNGDLTLQTSGDRTINIGNTPNQFSLTNLDQINGFGNIFIGTKNTPTININETLTVNDPLTLTANSINVNQKIIGNDNASITINGAGKTTTLKADITTQGNAITINDSILLADDVTLSTNSSRDSANINISGTVNGNHNLTLNGNNINVGGAIGSSSRLNNLETTASLTTLNGGSILTNGSQTFNSDLALGTNTTFDTPKSFNSGNINTRTNSVTVSAQTITTQNINTSGGNVNLNSKGNGDIQVNTINTSNPQGRGGNVEITTAGNFRATGAENGISINTNGGEGGAVTIDLFPGDLENQVREDNRLPFIVGNGSKNGTAGIIANNNFTIGNGDYFISTKSGNLELKLLGRLPSVEGTEIVQQPPVEPPREIAIAPQILPIATIDQVKDILIAIEREAAEKPALIYVSFTPKGFQPQDLEAEFTRREATNTQEYSRVNVTKANLPPTVNLPPADDDQLDILIITQKEKPLRMVIPVTRKEVVETAANLWAKTSDVFALDDSYKPYASDMYKWLIKPIEKELQARKISNLLFILPTEMRFIPIAALYDAENQQFLLEKYSSGLAPSLNLNDNRYRPLKDAGLLAMGASEFADSGVVPLPAARLELPSIRQVWTGKRPDNYQEYINENFTLEQIKANLSRQAFGIVHFGTHGDFNPTDTDESFLQLYDSRLNISEIRRLGLNNPLVELFVLSACETAFGNEIAELGFAGLAVQAGVKTAMGSVWQVSDTGTLALMTDFYSKLKNTTTKSEALRQAQLDMLKGKVYKTSDGNTIVTPDLEIPLDSLPDTSRFPEDFSHPFYWAPFTMIGNPW